MAKQWHFLNSGMSPGRRRRRRRRRRDDQPATSGHDVASGSVDHRYVSAVGTPSNQRFRNGEGVLMTVVFFLTIPSRIGRVFPITAY